MPTPKIEIEEGVLCCASHLIGRTKRYRYYPKTAITDNQSNIDFRGNKTQVVLNGETWAGWHGERVIQEQLLFKLSFEQWVYVTKLTIDSVTMYL